MGKIIHRVNGVSSSFNDISEKDTHLELNEDEDPLPEVQDTEYRMCRSCSTSAESLHGQAITDAVERSVESSQSCEKIIDVVTHRSPKSNLVYTLNASSSVKQAAIDNLSYRFSLKQIHDNNTIDEDENPLIGRKRKLSIASTFPESNHTKRPRKDCMRPNDELSAAIAPFDIMQQLLKASNQVTGKSTSMDTSGDSSTSTMTETCDVSLNDITNLAPPFTVGNATDNSLGNDNYPFKLLTFLNEHPTSEEDTSSGTDSVRDSVDSCLSSISDEISFGQCSSSFATNGEFEGKTSYKSGMIAEQYRNSKFRLTGQLLCQSSIPGSADYDVFQMCAPSHICTKGPRHSKKRH